MLSERYILMRAASAYRQQSSGKHEAEPYSETRHINAIDEARGASVSGLKSRLVPGQLSGVHAEALDDERSTASMN